jgi:hypothetical protein
MSAESSGGSSEIQPVGGISFGPTSLIAAADWTRARLSTFGVPFPPGNRLQRAQSLLKNLQARRPVLAADSALVDQVTEAQWTIVELYIATRGLGSAQRELSDVERAKCEEMLSGAEMPEADRNPLARNTQFEMYLAALFKMGDVRVMLAEPDLLIDYQGTPCGVAAKRVRSFRQAPKCAREAADQLRASGRPGFVAVNVDVLLKLGQDLPGPEATLAERLAVLDAIEATMAEREDVLGTITLGRDAIWDFSGEKPGVSVSHSLRFTPHPRTAHAEAEARAFFERMNAMIDRRMATL